MMPSIIDLWLTFLAAILASGHCIGMCGGMVVAYSLKLSQQGGLSNILPHLLYSVGRIVTYASLGAISGWLGSLSFTMERPEHLYGVPYFVAGGLMVWMGLKSTGLLQAAIRNGSGALGAFSGVIRRCVQRAQSGGTFFLGMVTGFLPCTLHWAFQVKALTTGSVAGGVAILIAFGMGTLPALWGFGLISTWLGSHARRRLLQVAGLLIVLMGLLTIRRGLMTGWQG